MVDLGVCSQGVDKTDVRTFRCLDRAHTAVVRGVNVTDFEVSTVTGKTARTECGQTTLMSKLCQRVRLIHELGQLGRTEELLNCCAYRTCIYELVRMSRLFVGSCVHALTDVSFHTGETDTDLVLEEFTNRTDTTVTEVVDVISNADTILQTEQVADGSNDILEYEVLRHELCDLSTESFHEFFSILALLCCRTNLSDDAAEDLCANHFVNRGLVDIEALEFLSREAAADELVSVYTGITDDLERLIGDSVRITDLSDRIYIYFINTGILDLPSLVGGDDLTGLEEQFTVVGNDIGNCLVTLDTGSEGQLLIQLINTYARKVISLRIEEHAVEERFRTFERCRLTRTELVVELGKTFLTGVGSIFCDRIRKELLIAEKIDELFVCADTQRTQENGQRELSCTVNTDVDNAVCVCFIFQPGTTVRDDLRGIKISIGFIVDDVKIRTRGTDKLADDNTLSTVDDKCTVFGHDREITDEDILVFYLTGTFIQKANFNFERSCEIAVFFFTLLNCVCRVIDIEFLANEG